MTGPLHTAVERSTTAALPELLGPCGDDGEMTVPCSRLSRIPRRPVVHD
jgi:hypothetical protein